MPLFGPPDVSRLKTTGDIPGLLRALGQTKHGEARRFAAEALGQLGDARAVEPLSAALADQDKYLAHQAAQALGLIGDPRAVESLIAALDDSDYSLSIKSAWALGQIGGPAVDPLVAIVEERRPTSKAAAFALGCSGDARAVGSLVGAVAAGDAALREAAAKALSKIGEPAVEPLIAVLADRQTATRRAAAQALGLIGDPRAVGPLAALCQDQSAAVRKAAAAALDSLDWQGGEGAATADYWIAKREWDKCVEIGVLAVEPLTSALKDDSAKVRKGAALALGRIGDPLAVEALKTVLQDPSKTVCSAAATALDSLGWQADASQAGAAYWIAKGKWATCVEIGEAAVEALVPELRSKDSCPDAAQALGRIGSARAVGPLVAALTDERLVPRGPSTREVDPARARGLRVPVPGEPDVREAVADALAAIGAPAVEPLIAELGEWNLRDLVVRALTQIGEPAVEPLIAALLDESWTVRESAITALAKLEWSPEPTRAGAIYCVRREDWSACAAIGGPAVKPLIAELSHENGAHRYGAAEALTAIWRSGRLESGERTMLLARRDTITTPHTDSWSRYAGDDVHEDRGIGVDFPL
jgi:HEAT repeat protein